jgi:hypothetical protein
MPLLSQAIAVEPTQRVNKPTYLEQQDANSELVAYLKNQADEVAPEIEIDSEADCFGLIYRVWYGTRHLGNFFYNPVTETWIVDAFREASQQTAVNADEARDKIIRVWSR